MPRTIKQLPINPTVVLLQQLLRSHGYLRDRLPAEGLFDQVTHDETVVFQTQHIDSEGLALHADGVVGRKTWWALHHGSGEKQRNNFIVEIPSDISALRAELLNLALKQYYKPVFESPDGSNRSAEIDEYWGKTGLIGLPWCCAFVSWVLFHVFSDYPIAKQHHVGVQKMHLAAVKENLTCNNPKPGDIFVQLFSGGKGHTGFVLGRSARNDSIYTIEGNCGNRLKVGLRKLVDIFTYIDCFNDSQSINYAPITLNIGSLSGQTTR
ncbi:NlpC/P60 family protein [Flocculibacter collagenilyticus]|uniref:NlpC/P60 family protein n=1 Tax=Flocculibacter collagenilyticus TaxID=2744479 RepID=UPI0018F28794|nr:CHAP domain-containing protein [Flocculibacter collagenilyticus]